MTYPNWKENGKIKLMIIVGTRPEIIRLASVIKKSRKYFEYFDGRWQKDIYIGVQLDKETSTDKKSIKTSSECDVNEEFTWRRSAK